MNSSLKNIKHLFRLISERDIITDLYSRYGSYYDEPKLYSFVARLNLKKSGSEFSQNEFSGGSSFSEQRALLRCLGETIERYALQLRDKYNLIWASYSDLERKAVNPRKFILSLRHNVKINFTQYNNDHQKMYWIGGFSLIDKKNIFLPAQLVFVPYEFKLHEPVLRFPTTTGAASQDSLNKSNLNGLLEVIERDAFMINYLNKLSRNIIDIEHSSNNKLKEIHEYIKRYNLDLFIVDISTDVPVYVIMSIIIDKTGLGPAVSVGLKSSLSLKDAILGSIEETLHVRPWARGVMIKNDSNIKKSKNKKSFVSTMEERALLWSDRKSIDNIKFFLRGEKIKMKEIKKSKTHSLKDLIQWFRQQRQDIFYVDLTPSYFQKENIYISKVIVPGFQPLYMDERFPRFANQRLRDVPLKLGFHPLKKINNFPHPFL